MDAASTLQSNRDILANNPRICAVLQACDVDCGTMRGLGVVHKLVPSRKFGFIRGEGDKDGLLGDIFFSLDHVPACVNVKIGLLVEFRLAVVWKEDKQDYLFRAMHVIPYAEDVPLCIAESEYLTYQKGTVNGISSSTSHLGATL